VEHAPNRHRHNVRAARLRQRLMEAHFDNVLRCVHPAPATQALVTSALYCISHNQLRDCSEYGYAAPVAPPAPAAAPSCQLVHARGGCLGALPAQWRGAITRTGVQMLGRRWLGPKAMPWRGGHGGIRVARAAPFPLPLASQPATTAEGAVLRFRGGAGPGGGHPAGDAPTIEPNPAPWGMLQLLRKHDEGDTSLRTTRISMALAGTTCYQVCFLASMHMLRRATEASRLTCVCLQMTRGETWSSQSRISSGPQAPPQPMPPAPQPQLALENFFSLL
jgi:hypothetical protein